MRRRYRRRAVGKEEEGKRVMMCFAELICGVEVWFTRFQSSRARERSGTERGRAKGNRDGTAVSRTDQRGEDIVVI